MKMKQILIMMLSMVLVACISVAVTIAYFTDTDEVTNTFTVGKVGIKLDEAEVDEEGKAIDAEKKRTEDGNDSYQLIPGRVLDKDPKITVDGDSENCYVVAKIEVTGAKELEKLLKYEETSDGNAYIGFGGFVSGGQIGGTYNPAHTTGDTTMAGWVNDKVFLTQEPNFEDGSYTFYMYFENPQAANAELKLFETITVPGTWTNDNVAALENMEIVVSAYAIQSEGFDNVYEAFAAYNAQNN